MEHNENFQEALVAYQQKQKSIAQLIDSIRSKLEADADRPFIDWASVGDLGHVEEKLQELEEFLS